MIESEWWDEMGTGIVVCCKTQRARKENRVESSRRIMYIRKSSRKEPGQETRVENGKEARETESRREMEIDRAEEKWYVYIVIN
jgi:hypothetical protein